MDGKELIKLLKDWGKNQKGIELELEFCEEAMLEYSLAGQSDSERSDYITNYELSKIRNIKAPKIFRQLRQVTEKEVTKKKCRLVLTQLLIQNNQQINNNTNTNNFSHIDLNQAPDISDFDFYGREKELSNLQKLIVTERCRVVGVLGISGIGKSALVRELVENIQQYFDYVIWKSLKYSPSLAEILTDIESYFPCNNLVTSIDQRIFNLINYFNTHRCLLIFDQWEGVMETSEASPKQQQIDSSYEIFLKIIGTSKHQSCLVFTSLQKPKVMDLLVTKSIKQFSLTGLENKDAKTLLQDLKLSGQGMELLIERYQGHPLALIVASDHIKRMHNGQIEQFLKGTLFLPGVILTLLDKLFSYLSNLEIKILQNLAMETEPKLLSQFYGYFPSNPQSDISQAIDKLWQIGLIEKEDIQIIDEKNRQEYKILWVINPLLKKYIIKRYKN
ncbi:hypothetical protein A0J48_011050 [Sphaerospermopsis aphanizomenoides BCCUSP55]|uniref:NB-ARC domain-containing protein n=1 Tax=Sphaerospermopsis aphanizomenoides TaxID=459663 RepID=UPI00190444AD|nr:ATP-binding protein [Sphaerospermopsis aphanizomenoides]MBK1988070.1 hypothetical protein [Sphaerospermopsis aphanizomenoides BCCUSP55]